MTPFDSISPKDKNKLLKELETITLNFKENENILSAINNYNFIGIIVSGYVQVIRQDYNGNQTIVDEIFENNLFGSKIYSLTNNEYEIITKDKTEVIIIDYDLIINNRFNNSSYYNQFIKNLFQMMTSIIDKKNERIEILTKRSIRNKLLEYFRLNTNKKRSNYFYLPFSFTDLADYLSVDRSAMTREIKSLKDDGFIEVKNRKITLLYR